MTTYAHLWDPFREVEAMLAGVDRALDRAWTTSGPGPGVNVYADDDSVVVTSELPGVASADVQVQLQDDMLSISAERRAADEAGESLVRERSVLRVNRSVSLPFSVDPERVEARLADGVLTVALKRSAADKPRRISVTSN
jgi:HSP20 family protein